MFLVVVYYVLLKHDYLLLESAKDLPTLKGDLPPIVEKRWELPELLPSPCQGGPQDLVVDYFMVNRGGKSDAVTIGLVGLNP